MAEQSSRLKEATDKIYFMAVSMQEMAKQLQQLAELQDQPQPKEKKFGVDWFIDELRSYTRNNFLPSLGDAEDFIEFDGSTEYGGYKVTASFDDCAIEDAISNQVRDLHDEFIYHIQQLAEEDNNED